MSWGFPTNNKPAYSVDTSSKKQEFLHTVKLSEKYWAEDNFEESLVKLRIAIKLGKFIVQNEPKGPVRDSFIQKLTELAAREEDRSKQMREGKPVQYTNQIGGAGGGKGKGDNEDDKLRGAISEAIVTEKPNVRWEDISGLENAKNALKEAVIIPIRFPQIFTGARKPWKGILLYGPPGTGKTFLAKACATQANGTFFSVTASDLMSKYVGESEKLIRSLFCLAREKKPSIIFIDEVDSMCGKRGDGEGNESSRRVKTEFLVQMQGVGKDDQGILVLGATNLPWDLDPAIRRRFQRRIYISLPEKEARYGMLKHGFRENKNNITESQFQYFAEKTEGYSGSDISILVKDAVYEPVRQLQAAKKFRRTQQGKLLPCGDQESGPDVIEGNWMTVPRENIEIPIITVKDLQIVILKTKASVDRTQLKQYQQWTSQFGQDG